MEDRAKIQPIPSPHNGYTYSLLYFRGEYLINEKAKVPCKGKQNVKMVILLARLFYVIADGHI